MSIKPNRFRLNNMSNDELAKFLFSEEFDYIQRKYGEGPEAFSKWLQQEYDDDYPYKVVELVIADGNVAALITNFNHGEIEVGDKLELMPIEGITYVLTVYQIKYPMHIGDKYYARARFDNVRNVPLSILDEVPYRGCKVIKTPKKRIVEVYLV